MSSGRPVGGPGSLAWSRRVADALPAVRRRTVAFLLGTGAIAATFAYDYTGMSDRPPLSYNFELQPHEWLFAVSLVAFGCYVLVPLAANRELTRRRWRQLRRRPVGLAAFGYLVFAFVVGLFGPLFVGEPGIGTAIPYQPPFGIGVNDQLVFQCSGTVSDGTCYGSLQHPLGTTGNGQGLGVWIVYGFRVAVEVGLISAMFLVPAGTLVGTAAAVFGDLLQAIPAFFVYLVAQYVYGPTLSLMLVTFGALSWGGVARMVRAEALGAVEEGYVRAAESVGASRLSVLRQHLVPNVANTVVTAVTVQVPTLILLEAGLSYLGFGDPATPSFGWFISSVTNGSEFPLYWWLSVFPTIALGLTVLSLNVFGDALRDVLDPRLDR